tara:strand:+ start:1024 stop:1245 length:222 start_codon:yes stop_codon:yes gene_type:complete
MSRDLGPALAVGEVQVRQLFWGGEGGWNGKGRGREGKGKERSEGVFGGGERKNGSVSMEKIMLLQKTIKNRLF